jgi:hypothetical protein
LSGETELKETYKTINGEVYVYGCLDCEKIFEEDDE